MAGNWGTESWRSHPKSRELANIRDRPESTGIIIVSSYPFLSIYCVLATVICTYISVTILTLMPQNWRLFFPCFCLKSESLTNLYLVSATVWYGLVGDRWGGWALSLLIVTKDPERQSFQLPVDDPHEAHTSMLAGVRGGTQKTPTQLCTWDKSVASLWFMAPPPNQSHGPVNLHRVAGVMFLKYTSSYFATLMEILLPFYHLKLKPSCCITPLTLFNLVHSILGPLSTNSCSFITCAENPWLFQALPWLRIFLYTVPSSPSSMCFPSAWLILLYSSCFSISVSSLTTCKFSVKPTVVVSGGLWRALVS